LRARIYKNHFVKQDKATNFTG